MTAILVRVKRRGEHLDVASPLALTTVLADLDLVATLVHAEQAPAGRDAFGVLGFDLDYKIKRMNGLNRRGLSHRRSGGRGSCCKSASRLKRLELCGCSCL